MKDSEIISAEVMEVIYVSDKMDQLYGVKFRELGGSAFTTGADTTANDNIAIPLNYANVRIPIIGEVVVIIKATNALSSGVRNNKSNYYIDVITLQHSINHNSLPTLTKSTSTGDQASAGGYQESSAGNTSTSQNNPDTDENFTLKTNIRPLQPFVGDTILSGRYGSSLRFSTNPKGGKFTVQPKFKGEPGLPITIMRNTVSKEVDERKFIVEDFNKEDNVFVLASGQELEFKPSSTSLKALKTKQINTWQTEKFGKTPQAFLSSGRIVFNSTQKEIIAFAKKGIALSSESDVTIDAKQSVVLNGQKIELGDLATEPLVLGTQLQLWLTNFVTVLGTVIVSNPVAGPCLPLSLTPAWPTIQALVAQLPTVLSSSVFTTKQTSS